MVRNDDRRRGLAALEQSRAQRRRALVAGRVYIRGGAPQFWLWTVVVFFAFGVVYWNIAERELQSQKSEVMARQRAIKQELEPRILPLRDRIESWVMDLAGEWEGDYVASELSLKRLSESKGIYLRLLHDQAAAPEDIRAGMQVSLHDGFTSCLFKREEHYRQSERKRCHSIAQCPSGEICNDWSLCSPPSQPFNLRMMYRALRVLSQGWSDDLHQASDDYQLRLFSRDLEKAAKDDVPLAIQLITQAKYFTAVLDEEPAAGMPEARSGADAGLGRVELQVQLVEHPVRIAIWDIESEKQLFRMRTHAGAKVLPIGRNHLVDQAVMDAQQRQANNCGIALDVKDKIMSAKGTQTAEPQAAPSAESTPVSPAGSAAAD